MSNSQALGKSASGAYGALISEFEKGNVSYPRTSGLEHNELTIINHSAINREVKSLLEYNNPYTIINKDFVQGDVFILANELKLSTPGSLVSDVEDSTLVKDFEDADLMVGFREEYEYEMVSSHIDKDNFDFNLFLAQAYSNEEKVYNREDVSMRLLGI
jgi:hypothetical protein